ncbi:DUF4184 family protein [Microbacterium sp. 1P10UB]|uniref:DUF4184 family protein n=1 Tax=unclassified Microbacterium TaxID=2609290 RepID=UPI00399EFE88
MPFTASHAVVALAFVRTPLVPAAIAIGAMTPDLPLFLRGWGIDYGRTHSLSWLPVTMLVALALLLVWRCLLRPAVRELLPRTVARRIPADWDTGPVAALRETFGGTDGSKLRSTALLLISLALGVASHIAWDVFTHEGRWGTELLPVLDQDWGPLTGYKWLQHGSSVVGLVVIAVWAAWALRRRPAGWGPERLLPVAVRFSWWLSLPAVLVLAWGTGLVIYGPLSPTWTVAHLAYRVLPPACAVWGVLTLLLCTVVVVVRRAVLRPGERAKRSDTPGTTPDLPTPGA